MLSFVRWLDRQTDFFGMVGTKSPVPQWVKFFIDEEVAGTFSTRFACRDCPMPLGAK